MAMKRIVSQYNDYIICTSRPGHYAMLPPIAFAAAVTASAAAAAGVQATDAVVRVVLRSRHIVPLLRPELTMRLGGRRANVTYSLTALSRYASVSRHLQ